MASHMGGAVMASIMLIPSHLTVRSVGDSDVNLVDPGRQDVLAGAGFVKVVSQRGRQLRRPCVTLRAAQNPAREASGSARLVRPPAIEDRPPFPIERQKFLGPWLPWPTQKRYTLDVRSTLFQSPYFPRDIPAPADISQKTKICCNRKYKTELNGGVFHGGSFVGLATFIFIFGAKRHSAPCRSICRGGKRDHQLRGDCTGPDSAFTNYDRSWLGWRLSPY
jgi:hypothetical protein